MFRFSSGVSAHEAYLCERCLTIMQTAAVQQTLPTIGMEVPHDAHLAKKHLLISTRSQSTAGVFFESPIKSGYVKLLFFFHRNFFS